MLEFYKLDCNSISYSSHAIKEMFNRNIKPVEVNYVINNGEVISDYPNDKPYPSMLLFAFVNDKPIHVVLAKDEVNQSCIVITAYKPDKKIWTPDFKTKKHN